MKTAALPCTPFPEINELLSFLLREIRDVLEDQFVGMYLHGSLAMGDFNLDTSDIGYIVITADKISDRRLASLVAMHSRITSTDAKWPSYLEGSFIPRAAIRRYDPANCHHPRHGVGEPLRIESHDSDWVIQRYILFHHGVTLAGPPPKDLIDPVQPDELHKGVIDLLWWWEFQLEDTVRIQEDAYRAYAILTMCRILYTLEFGTIVTKPAAARWAEDSLGDQWSDLVEQGLRWSPGKAISGLDEVMAFIHFTLDKAGQTWGKSVIDGRTIPQGNEKSEVGSRAWAHSIYIFVSDQSM